MIAASFQIILWAEEPVARAGVAVIPTGSVGSLIFQEVEHDLGEYFLSPGRISDLDLPSKALA